MAYSRVVGGGGNQYGTVSHIRNQLPYVYRGIFLCLLFATLLGASLTFYDKFFGDYIVIASVILFTFGLGLFVSDSVFDFADAITQIPLYGNMDNAPFRVVIIIFSVVGILLAVAGSFFRRVKDDRL